MLHVGDGLVDSILRSAGDVDTGATLGELQGCLIADTRVAFDELVRSRNKRGEGLRTAGDNCYVAM